MSEFMEETAENRVDTKSRGPKMTRRQFLESAIGAAIGATTTYGLASFVNDDLLNRPGLSRQILQGWRNRGSKNENIIQSDQISPTPPEIVPIDSDPTIRKVEEDLGIRLLPLREAYELNGLHFDELDRNEFGDELPMRWDYPRAAMVEEFYDLLPPYFHKPDAKGTPLVLTLTNFSATSSEAADFLPQTPLNLIRLDMDAFDPNDKSGAYETLTHESIHRMQDLGYSQLDQTIPKIFNQDITTFSKDTIAWLDSHQVVDPEVSSALGFLRYGVQDLLSKDTVKSPRSNTVELEAVFGQFYIHGKDYFLDILQPVYGDKADILYTYMKDTIFRGMEYTKFPYETQSENESLANIPLFNSVVSDLISSEGQKLASIPYLDAGTFDFQNQDLIFQEAANAPDNRIVRSMVWSDSKNSSYPVVAQKTVNDDLSFFSEQIVFSVDQNGNRISSETNQQKLPREVLQSIGEKLFSFPKDEFQWKDDQNPQEGYGRLGTVYKDKKWYTIIIRENGQVYYNISEPDPQP